MIFLNIKLSESHGMTKENIKETGRSTFLSESQTLIKVAESLDDHFVKTVDLCHKTKGRIILTGIGKNQHVGQKIAATLNSTGSPAIFMHAADAIHGDLGIIQADDLIICLSKSGNSPEIKALIPLLKALNNTVIAVTSVLNSYLARQADHAILLPIDREACPHNLAPTNSTTAFLVFGDALAICLLKLNGFTSEDFARLHPGGALGKRLHLKVSDLYPSNEKPLVRLDTTLQDSILEMSAKRLGATAVLDMNDKPVGIITDGDLRRLLEKSTTLNTLTARDAMCPNPKTIHPEAFATEALDIMRSNNITQLLVVEEDEYLGVIHIHDILREGIV